MILKFNYYLSLLCVVLSPYLSIGQPHPILSEFYGFQNNSSVKLNWTIKGGNQCNGTRIYRAPDTINYIEIGEIPGVCGSTTDDIGYSFTDEDPIINSFNYYRLEMGIQGFSDFVKIEYRDYDQKDFILVQNPSTGSFRILFDNQKGEKYSFELYSLSGSLTLQRTTTDDFINLKDSKLRSGTYIFSISNGQDTEITGKLIHL